jgi:RimJ/RimL family protein N-acetyltransferase
MDLVVRTPRLELRYPDDALLFELAELATEPIHSPDTMPFSYPWTDVSPEQRGRGTLTHNWKARAEWSADAWICNLVTVVDGKVVGTQGLQAASFPKTRSVSTGSWLSMSQQGKGVGKEMRAAAVHLAFAGLGAERCLSGAFEDNAASLGVSRALGYVENGDEIITRRDGAGRIIRLLLTREVWERDRRADIEIVGLDGCKELFGL